MPQSAPRKPLVASSIGVLPRIGQTIAAFGLLLVAACSNDGSAGPDPAAPACESGQSHASTFAAIQSEIFEAEGCTAQACHGASRAGGLDLQREVAWQNLFEVAATGSTLRRIEPGYKDRSWLWLKLAAATWPEDAAAISGAPMPVGREPLDEARMEALRRWIYAGAPEDGVVGGTDALLGSCLPEAKPIAVKPLDAPAPGTGVQFVLPPTDLPGESEQELCFATWYDLSGEVPAQYLDPTGQYVRIDEQELRQDPLSHHLVLIHSGLSAGQIHDPSFGTWTCVAGTHAGEVCEPTDLGACGAGGICRSTPDTSSVGCIGYGPPGVGLAVLNRQIGGAQEAQAYMKLHPGVYAQIPIRGLLYWSTHAFNLTREAHQLNGRSNFGFAEDQRYPLRALFDSLATMMVAGAPYSRHEICAEHVLAQGARLFGMTSHTHKRGKLFRAWHPDGRKIFENTLYSDPVKQQFSPPLEFDSPDAAARTIRYCAVYENGVGPDGQPDPETVTRASRIPSSALATFGGCEPVACAAGRIGAPCDDGVRNRIGDDAACDSTPGAADGWCDACPITAGESTENEMFILFGQYWIDPAFPQPQDDFIWAGLASVP